MQTDTGRDRLLVLGEASWPSDDQVLSIGFENLDRRGLKLSPELELEIHDEKGEWQRVLGVIWRGQFDELSSTQHNMLHLVRASGVPCINSALTLLHGSHRIAIATALKRYNLPVVPSYFFLGSAGIGYFFEPDLPCVVKAGNWHMGYGKVKASTKEVWSDTVDLAVLLRDLIGVEPYLSYTRDLRVLIVGEEVIGFERIPSQWRANVSPSEGNIVELPEQILKQSKEAAICLRADVLGVDWVQVKDGSWVLLEANIAPGLELAGHDFRPHVLSLLRTKLHDSSVSAA